MVWCCYLVKCAGLQSCTSTVFIEPEAQQLFDVA